MNVFPMRSVGLAGADNLAFPCCGQIPDKLSMVTDLIAMLSRLPLILPCVTRKFGYVRLQLTGGIFLS